MTTSEPRWEDVQEEELRPRQRVDRHALRVCWLEWPDARKRMKSLGGLTDEEVDWLARMVLVELARRKEGRLAAARLLVKYGGGPNDDHFQARGVG